MRVSFKAARGLLGSMLATLLVLALATLLLGGRPASGQGRGLLVASGLGINLVAPVQAASAPATGQATSTPGEAPPPPAPASAAPAPASGHASLLPWPFRITAEFGHYPNGNPHYGLDIGASKGVAQTAPVGGPVEEVLRGCVFGDYDCGCGRAIMSGGSRTRRATISCWPTSPRSRTRFKSACISVPGN